MEAITCEDNEQEACQLWESAKFLASLWVLWESKGFDFPLIIVGYKDVMFL